MSIEVTILISVMGVCLSGLFGFAIYLRNKRTDDQAEATQSATILTELKNILTGIADIKRDISDIKEDAKKDHDSIIRQDESLKSAWASIKELRLLLAKPDDKKG
ncbi:MAG: hypothetical protein K0R00_3211 [Herbinix sp.]|jgi:peptidoglycan hydrolase CwlO-like protein|nr:hypothetical protein [Herbinix sp.]